MPSEVDLCNLALSHVGARARITSRLEATPTAEVCNRFYDVARTYALTAQHANWSFARKITALNLVDNTREDTWRFAYGKPSDLLRLLGVLAKGDGVFGRFPLEGNPERFVGVAEFFAPVEVVGSTLYTDEENAQALYVADVSNTALFPPEFTLAFSYVLAALIAGPVLTGDSGAQASARLWGIANPLLLQAAGTDAAQQHPAQTVPRIKQVRSS